MPTSQIRQGGEKKEKNLKMVASYYKKKKVLGPACHAQRRVCWILNPGPAKQTSSQQRGRRTWRTDHLYLGRVTWRLLICFQGWHKLWVDVRDRQAYTTQATTHTPGPRIFFKSCGIGWLHMQKESNNSQSHSNPQNVGCRRGRAEENNRHNMLRMTNAVNLQPQAEPDR